MSTEISEPNNWRLSERGKDVLTWGSRRAVVFKVGSGFKYLVTSRTRGTGDKVYSRVLYSTLEDAKQGAALKITDLDARLKQLHRA